MDLTIYSLSSLAVRPDNNDDINLAKEALDLDLSLEFSDDKLNKLKKILFPTLESSVVRIGVVDYDGYKIFRAFPTYYQGPLRLEMDIFNPTYSWCSIPCD